ncbi:MAG: DNA mismatch repair endonuclease MutL [Candidatus Dormibacteria bacterium]
MIATAAIRALPAEVADAIAAGEVVERPAAVVKELMENSVDAGSTRIDVRIDGGGLTRIRVADDGAGIAADQLGLALACHATSKITAVSDLARISSLGFRGEALASIAAVSDLWLRSRPRSAPDGAEIRVRGAGVIARGVCAMAEGTVAEICDLFVLTPARLAFLRGSRAEAGACVRAVADCALANPGVAMTCVSDGRTVLRTPGTGFDDALRAVLGDRAAAELVAVDSPGEISVGGRISAPHAHRGDRTQLTLVVNGRRVHNRALVVAVEEAYRGLLPAGRHPFGAVTVECDPASIDVNVHPTKREVRFREERLVFSAVQRACWAAIAESAVATGGSLLAPAPLPVQPSLGQAAAVLSVSETPPRWNPSSSPSSTAAEPGTPALGDLAPLQPLGQAGAGWLLARSARGCAIIDPHAAHEKVLYARLMEAAAAGSAAPAAQLLLGECVVDVDAAALELVEDEELRRLGFDIEPFGPGMVRCHAVPAAASTTAPEQLIAEVLTAVQGEATQRRHRVAALTACHAAVKLGDRLGTPEQEQLLRELTTTRGGITCPHGRPTVVLLDDATLRHAFGRPPT